MCSSDLPLALPITPGLWPLALPITPGLWPWPYPSPLPLAVPRTHLRRECRHLALLRRQRLAHLLDFSALLGARAHGAWCEGHVVWCGMGEGHIVWCG